MRLAHKLGVLTCICVVAGCGAKHGPVSPRAVQEVVDQEAVQKLSVSELASLAFGQVAREIVEVRRHFEEGEIGTGKTIVGVDLIGKVEASEYRGMCQRSIYWVEVPQQRPTQGRELAMKNSSKFEQSVQYAYVSDRNALGSLLEGICSNEAASLQYFSSNDAISAALYPQIYEAVTHNPGARFKPLLDALKGGRVIEVQGFPCDNAPPHEVCEYLRLVTHSERNEERSVALWVHAQPMTYDGKSYSPVRVSYVNWRIETRIID